MKNLLKACWTIFLFKVLVWSGGQDILGEAVKVMMDQILPEKVTENPKEVPDMMQNQYLTGILLARGCPPKEAEIRSEIFGLKDMPAIRDKLYFFKSAYWIDV